MCAIFNASVIVLENCTWGIWLHMGNHRRGTIKKLIHCPVESLGECRWCRSHWVTPSREWETPRKGIQNFFGWVDQEARSTGWVDLSATVGSLVDLGSKDFSGHYCPPLFCFNPSRSLFFLPVTILPHQTLSPTLGDNTAMSHCIFSHFHSPFPKTLF